MDTGTKNSNIVASTGYERERAGTIHMGLNTADLGRFYDAVASVWTDGGYRAEHRRLERCSS